MDLQSAGVDPYFLLAEHLPQRESYLKNVPENPYEFEKNGCPKLPLQAANDRHTLFSSMICRHLQVDFFVDGTSCPFIKNGSAQQKKEK